MPPSHEVTSVEWISVIGNDESEHRPYVMREGANGGETALSGEKRRPVFTLGNHVCSTYVSHMSVFLSDQTLPTLAQVKKSKEC